MWMYFQSVFKSNIFFFFFFAFPTWLKAVKKTSKKLHMKNHRTSLFHPRHKPPAPIKIPQTGIPSLSAAVISCHVYIFFLCVCAFPFSLFTFFSSTSGRLSSESAPVLWAPVVDSRLFESHLFRKKEKPFTAVPLFQWLCLWMISQLKVSSQSVSACFVAR